MGSRVEGRGEAEEGGGYQVGWLSVGELRRKERGEEGGRWVVWNGGREGKYIFVCFDW